VAVAVEMQANGVLERQGKETMEDLGQPQVRLPQVVVVVRVLLVEQVAVL
jgi:hypothetical protein